MPPRLPAVALLVAAGCSDGGQPGVGSTAGADTTTLLTETGASSSEGSHATTDSSGAASTSVDDSTTATSDTGVDPTGSGCDDEGGCATALFAGGTHTCVRLSAGTIRCWGWNQDGQLGYGHSENIGDDETPASAGDVQVGGVVQHVVGGYYHTCALLAGGAVRCWGDAFLGKLGTPGEEDIGDDELPIDGTDVELGGPAISLAAGTYHTCALLVGGRLRCWGQDGSGALGYGIDDAAGQLPSALGDVDVGGTVVQVAAGGSHTCALVEDGRVRCWGFGDTGATGLGTTEDIGDDELPSSVPDVDVGGPVIQIWAGEGHTCALLEQGTVRCWGFGSGGLGYGNTETIGDDESPASAGDIDVGEPVLRLADGGAQRCVLLEGGRVRCWGFGLFGALGYGNGYDVGDDETPADVGDIDVGGVVTSIVSGAATCALLEGDLVRCWGRHDFVGYPARDGMGENIGDDETPASVGYVEYL